MPLEEEYHMDSSAYHVLGLLLGHAIAFSHFAITIRACRLDTPSGAERIGQDCRL